jgi:hypothetical protein
VSAPRRRPQIIAAITTAWGLSLMAAFLLNRTHDLPRLPGWLSANAAAFGSGAPVALQPLVESAAGVAITALMVLAWWGIGDAILRALERPTPATPTSGWFGASIRCLYGAAAVSTLLFALGLAHLYRTTVALALLVVGLGLAAQAWRRRQTAVMPDEATWPRGTGILSVGVQALALCAALAPPTANDTLLYHLALPKAWVSAGGMVEIPDNIARFYPLGAEMHCVWAMLLGQPWTARVGEAAAMVAIFAFSPLLVLLTHGWARERGLSPRWASLAALTVATIPTVYWVAGNGYIDLVLTAYTLLAVRALGRWWTTAETTWLRHMAFAVGAALAVKLSAAALGLPLLLLVLVRSLRRGDMESAGATHAAAAVAVRTGAICVLVTAMLAAPWYVRNWVQTGSPFFPFFPNLWPGSAPGWDLDRARLYESLFFVYGRPGTVLDDVLAPVFLSVIAQPELPNRYDGVLGIALLFALPALVWACWTRRLDVELRLAVTVSCVLYLVWLGSSQQFRYLLPAVPLLVVAAMASAARAAESVGLPLERAFRGVFIAAAAVNALLVVSWFAELAPVRVVLGGETRDSFLARRLDYYGYYRIINRQLSPDVRVWLIDMRRDTYHIDRPHVGDFIFEDHTLKTWVRQATSAAEVLDRARAAGITHVLVRHDILLDYARSTIVDDRLSREENVANLLRTRAFFADGTRVLRVDGKYGLIELPRGRGKLGATAAAS